MMPAHFLHHVFKAPPFTTTEVEQIIAKFKKVEFSKHDFLLREGQTEQHYWFIQEGFARSFVVDTAGHDISTQFYTVGDVVIDWPSFFQRNPTRENIQALTDLVCWQLDFEGFQHLFHGSEAFREAGRARLVSSYFDLKRNSIAMIADQAKDRYQRLLLEKPAVVQHVSLKHIATYLGITDTSLSRIRKELARP
jgi:CRP-like cAMP-binding protein